MPDHAAIEPLLASYALGALPDDALDEVEEHLAECEECRAEFQQLLRLNAQIGLTAPRREPPPALRARVLEAARADLAHAAPAVPRPSPLAAVRAARRRSVPLQWAAAAFVVPLALSGWLAYQVVTLRTAMAAMQTQAQQAWRNATTVTDIMGRGIMVGAGTASVEGTELARAAGGMLYYLPSQYDGVLVVDGLPPLPKGQCYQIWLVKGDQSMSGGTFYLGADGKGIAIVKSPMPLSDVEIVRVTMEPYGGSDSPSSKRYLWARLTKT